MVVLKKYTEEGLGRKRVSELKKLLNERGVHGVWIAGANKKTLIQAILEGGKPDMLDLHDKDTLNTKTILAIRGLAEVFAEIVLDILKKREPKV